MGEESFNTSRKQLILCLHCEDQEQELNTFLLTFFYNAKRLPSAPKAKALKFFAFTLKSAN